MFILGLNAYHGDSAACVVRDGRLIAAVEEERFRRTKHWAGLPVHAVRCCLDIAGIALTDVDIIATNRDPKANLLKKLRFTLTRRPSLAIVANRLKNAVKVKGVKAEIAGAFGLPPGSLKAQVQRVEHHVAHLASSFLVSAFDRAALVSVDGFGDFVGAMSGVGKDRRIDIDRRIFFPHSLGLFYLAFTQYLGFPKYGDEYKVMGLAAYGKPTYMAEMARILNPMDGGEFTLDLDYFTHHSKGVEMRWNGGEPSTGAVFSKKLEALFGPSRQPGEPITEKHKNLAASMQKHYEDLFFNLLRAAHDRSGSANLALSGGCALNSLANGKIFARTPFKEVYIQPAAGDAGGAVGAAFYVWNRLLEQPRRYVLDCPYLGPEYGEKDYRRTLGIEGDGQDVRWQKSLGPDGETVLIDWCNDEAVLCDRVAALIARGWVVGWFQGRLEWGPRALGNRSVVCDPRRKDMKDILNRKIKRREAFRPFAPSILEEATGAYFEIDYPDPFMIKVYKIRPEKRTVIPAVTHADGTGRLQTVNKKVSPRYWHLIDAFRKITGVPVVLNTSFNENEPIVCRPEEAFNCFLRTRMDVLVLGDFVVVRGR
jgi:carbamoyltransferase